MIDNSENKDRKIMADVIKRELNDVENKARMIALFKNSIKDLQIELIDFVPFNEVKWGKSDQKNQTLAYVKTTEYYKTVYSIGKTPDGQFKFINNEDYLSTDKESFKKEVELLQINFEDKPNAVRLYIVKGYNLKEEIGNKIFLKKKGLWNYFKSPVEAVKLHLSLGEPWAKIGFKSNEEDIETLISIEEYNSLYVAFGMEIHCRKISKKPENKLKNLASKYRDRLPEGE